MLGWLFDLIYASKQHQPERSPELEQASLAHFRPQSIEDYRSKFATAPLGCWSQAIGTFGCINDEIWEFRPNRTGSVSRSGYCSGERGELWFEWQEVSAFTIACKVTKWPEDPDRDLERDEDEYPDEWQTICYDFKSVLTDVGESIGMCEIATDGTMNHGFWHSMEPLSYSRDL
jgi:hypothetical protein